MSKVVSKLLGFVAFAAFAVAVTAGGTASYGGLHQAVEPKELQKYKKV